MKHKIPLPGTGDAVFIEPRNAATTSCEVHDWPDEGMGRRLIAAMREAHSKGGVNVCTDCIDRAKRSARSLGIP